MLLWEIETGCIPFEGLDLNELKELLLDQKLRPKIPEGTD